MAGTLITGIEPSSNSDGKSDLLAPSSNGGSMFHRRIEFHLSKKPFTGFSSGRGDFRLETLNPSSDSKKDGSNHGGGPSTVAAGKKSENSEFLEIGLDPELSFRITFTRIGAGLENLGNTCFLNSVLQCLTYTEPLAAYLQSGKHQNSCRNAGFCALCAIQKHVSRALQSTGRILAPKDLVSNLRCISRSFRNSRQEDAHEYMVNLLESMHKCCLPSGVPSESPSAYDRSLVHKIFGGLLRSQVKCMQCNSCSNKFDPFLDLSLEINKADSLLKALAHFTAKEQLDGGERQYQCQHCKQKVKALKQLTVHKAPCVLTIHLKRFGPHTLGQKIDKKVHFGPTLDFKPFVSGPYDGDLKYTLYGVLVHAGWSTHSGHYYCFVRTSKGMWYSLDDNRVVQVNERMVLEQKAYMLFYFRDRQISIPKKLVIQKDNMALHGLGSRTLSNTNHGLKEAIQNSAIVKKLNDADSSSVACQRNTPSDGAPKGSLSESSSKFPPIKDPVPGGESSNKSSTITGSLNNVREDKTVKKDPSDSVAALSNCNGMQESAITGDQNNDSSALPPNCNGNTRDNNGVNSSVSLPPPNCNGANGSAGDTCITRNTSQMIVNEVSPQHRGEESSPEETNVAKLPSRTSNGETDVAKLPSRTSNGDLQIGGLSKENAAIGDSSMNEKGDSVVVQRQKKTIGSVELLNIKTDDVRDSRKLKKKLSKHRITSMHLAPNILLGASLGLRRKKKHKRSKKSNLGIKKLSSEHLLEVGDLGPSTSEKTSKISVGGSCHAKRKGIVPGVDPLTVNVDEEFRARVGQNGAMHATDELSRPCSNSGTPEIQRDAAHNASTDRKRDSSQNGLMNILTRGVDDRTVARWDGIDLPPSRYSNSTGGRNVSIGYVADEWDEELDRGRRKKVRTAQHIFGEPNPFQEVATKKAKLKKSGKMSQHNNGNQPFRI